MTAPRLLVAKSINGPVRTATKRDCSTRSAEGSREPSAVAPSQNATKREVCQHWMVRTGVSCGRDRYYRCAYGCGHSEARKEPS